MVLKLLTDDRTGYYYMLRKKEAMKINLRSFRERSVRERMN